MVRFSTAPEEHRLSPSRGLRDKPAVMWPTSLLIQLWQPGLVLTPSPPESGLQESGQARTPLSTLPPSGLHRCQHSPSPIPLRRERPRLCHKTNRLRYQKTQSQKKKKNPQRDLSQSIYKDVTRSYFECEPLAYCRQKPEQREKGGVEENRESKSWTDGWMFWF